VWDTPEREELLVIDGCRSHDNQEFACRCRLPACVCHARPTAGSQEVDIRLITELQRDGWATFQSLADLTGLSRTTISSRVQQLLHSRVIRIVAVLHPSLAGTSVIAHLAVNVDGPARPLWQHLDGLWTASPRARAVGPRPFDRSRTNPPYH
jgi:hypothetical protein